MPSATMISPEEPRAPAANLETAWKQVGVLWSPPKSAWVEEVGRPFIRGRAIFRHGRSPKRLDFSQWRHSPPSMTPRLSHPACCSPGDSRSDFPGDSKCDFQTSGQRAHHRISAPAPFAGSLGAGSIPLRPSRRGTSERQCRPRVAQPAGWGRRS